MPLEFVHQTLFPFSKQHLPGYLSSPEAAPSISAWAASLRAESAQQTWPPGAPPLELTESPDPQAILPLLQWLITNDIKSPVLKSIQGRIWRAGYVEGTLHGHLFEGVASALQTIRQRGITLAIYSSGSVEAQQLLMKYSTDGDLTPLFSGWYDTSIGGKLDSGSYLRIADSLKLHPSQILFATDNAAEARAALEAQMQIAASLRGVSTSEQFGALAQTPQIVAEDICAAILHGLSSGQ